MAQLQLVLALIGAAVVAWVARFLVTGYRIRAKCRKLPGPPHSWLLGNLAQMGEVAMSYPRRVHPHVFPNHLRHKHQLGSFFRLDVWPLKSPLIAILDPAISQQFSVEYAAPKHPEISTFLKHLAGPEDMVSLNGPLWAKWRRIFNPGFSTQQLVTLVPGIVDDVVVYVDILREYAEKGEVFRLEEATTRLTVDVIGRVTLDSQFNMQRSENPCIEAMRDQVHQLPNEVYLEALAMLNPVGWYKRWRNSRIMDEYIGRVLDERFAASAAAKKAEKRRTMLDLALNSYITGVEADVEKSDIPATTLQMDAAFRKGAITQIRVFIFAGHDTTSSTMCYAFYLLQKHPDCLQRICREHEEILGPLKASADRIRQQPHIVNQLEYTMAVVKETLRLFPPASGPRIGEPGLMLRDPVTGESYPTEGFLLWLNHYGLGRNERVWGPTANDFDPSRFLPENAHKIPEGAWRPFETGPRNCIGQNLALLESRIILALCCRQFDFELALDSIDKLKSDGSFYARDETFRQGPQNVDGEEMYQVLIGAAKPREGMPTRVRNIEDWRRSS